jgi:predicted phosphoribosyltransferase
MIKNRTDAGKKIARALLKYKGRDAVVYAIPRGGVIVGRVVADELGIPLDLVVTRKLVQPGNVNVAFGAVDEAGSRMIDDAELAKIDPALAEEEIQRQTAEVTRRANVYRAGKASISPAGKVAIIVDDGITTGYNIRPAVQYLKSMNPKKIVVAIPVAPRQSLEVVRSMVDEIVTLIPPETFGSSVDEHYVDFTQPSDQDVINVFLGRDTAKSAVGSTNSNEENFFQ